MEGVREIGDKRVKEVLKKTEDESNSVDKVGFVLKYVLFILSTNFRLNDLCKDLMI